MAMLSILLSLSLYIYIYFDNSLEKIRAYEISPKLILRKFHGPILAERLHF